MDETLVSSSIKKRLSLQNEVLKRLSEISEKLEKRANDTTVELHELLDQAGAVELDLKNAFSSFRSLSYTHHIDHRISDESDAAYHMKKGESSAKVVIPAQDYETDILPRFKEALSLGLTSCKNHFTKKGQSTRSIFSAGSTCGQLPHIIGSEEYIHDNSCGLTDELALRISPLDFDHILQPSGASSGPEGHGPLDLFGSDRIGMHQDLPGKDGTEPLVSAALDFKAMLEAALLNTYKFYDEESSSGIDAANDSRSSGGTQKDVNHESSTSSQTVLVGNSQHLISIAEEQTLPAAERNLTDIVDTDVRECYSSLVSGSLFDAEEPVAGDPDIPVIVNEDEFEQKVYSK